MQKSNKKTAYELYEYEVSWGKALFINIVVSLLVSVLDLVIVVGSTAIFMFYAGYPTFVLDIFRYKDLFLIFIGFVFIVFFLANFILLLILELISRK